jgi:hypothetical protein
MVSNSGIGEGLVEEGAKAGRNGRREIRNDVHGILTQNFPQLPTLELDRRLPARQILTYSVPIGPAPSRMY